MLSAIRRKHKRQFAYSSNLLLLATRFAAFFGLGEGLPNGHQHPHCGCRRLAHGRDPLELIEPSQGRGDKIRFSASYPLENWF